jgi:hypothetical protein
MRTTIDLDHDALAAVKEIAHMENTSLGKVVSRLLRQALTGGPAVLPGHQTSPAVTGFVPFESRGVVVSNELIDRLRDTEGV